VGASNGQERARRYKRLTELDAVDPIRFADHEPYTRLAFAEPPCVREFQGTAHLSEAEIALWDAVVWEGLADYLARPTTENGELRAAAWEWVETMRLTPGGFDWLCQLFGLDAGAARMALRLQRLRIVALVAARKATRLRPHWKRAS
jgi:hypothetical protein